MIQTPEQFRHWRKAHGFTQAEAAAQLGVSKRTIGTSESTGPVSRTVALACLAITVESWTEDFLERLVREQHPKLEQVLFVLPLVTIRKPGFATFHEHPGVFPPSMQEWLEEHAPSARLARLNVMTPAMSRWQVEIVTFEDPNEAFHFKMRWY